MRAFGVRIRGRHCTSRWPCGLCRCCRSFPEEGASRRFFWATLLCLPISLPALRNGQANALLAGLFAHATASLVEKEWWRAVLCLVVALAVKQFGIVFLLLAPV